MCLSGGRQKGMERKKTMTTNQPQPGSELDERLAKALGWKTIWDTESGYRYSMWVSPKADKYREEPLSYSTDTATAMATLEQLCKPKKEGGRGWGYILRRPKGTYEQPYNVRLSDEEGGFFDDIGSDISLAHAASLAMLAALEAEK